MLGNNVSSAIKNGFPKGRPFLDCVSFAQRKDNDAGGAAHLELLFHSKFFLKAI